MTTKGTRPALQASDILPDSTDVNGDHLSVGGCDLVTLAERYGTPLYVFDEPSIRSRARDFRSALSEGYPGSSSVCYAAKAYCAPWLLRVIAEEGLGLDVVSGGELHTALTADVPPAHIYFHGNNKSEDELELALESGVGRIVLDNIEEIRLLGRLAHARGVRQSVLLRVGPGIETDAHVHLRTGGVDSKFGLSIVSGQAEEGVRDALAHPALDLRGLHMHIGSQITDVDAYRTAIGRLCEFSDAMRERHRLEVHEISPGGGYGVRYTPEAAPVSARDMIRQVGEVVAEAVRGAGMDDPLPHVTIEPGRSLVAAAAVALYRVGSVKSIPGGRTYVSVDGGMADNMRPAAYGAEYTALIADRINEPPTADVTIAGKYCESGDVLVDRVHLPLPSAGDLVAIPTAGAYQLSMANNYNMALRPAVVVVADSRSRLVRRRETYADLLSRDLAATGEEVPSTGPGRIERAMAHGSEEGLMEALPVIDLTSSAARKLDEIRGEDPAHAFLRLYVMGRTCCGYRHGLVFAEQPASGESMVEVSGMRIAVDLADQAYREGATIDYVETAHGVGFAVRTPTSSAGCTCQGR